MLFALLWLTTQRWDSPVSCPVGSIYSKATGRKIGKFHLCAPLSTFDAAHSTLWSLSVEEPKAKPILPGFLLTMAIQVVEFSNGGTKLERFLPKNQHTLIKILNFENWVNGEVSKSAKSPNLLTFKVNFLYQFFFD